MSSLASFNDTLDCCNTILDLATVGVTARALAEQLTTAKASKDLDKNLEANVIGQDEAVNKVTRAIRRNRIGLNKSGRPIGSFLFVGPTEPATKRGFSGFLAVKASATSRAIFADS